MMQVFLSVLYFPLILLGNHFSQCNFACQSVSQWDFRQNKHTTVDQRGDAEEGENDEEYVEDERGW